MDVITKLLSDVKLPRMVKVVQTFDKSQLEDVSGELRKQLSRQEIRNTVSKDMNIAITCGSRGVDNYPLVLRELVHFCKERGANPFIVPAMGSHGGATGEGQRAVCEKLGVTEEYCGCQIRASMEVVEIGRTNEGHPVCIDKHASMADGIIVVNRIKNHTGFTGNYESGLMKIMTIGLGKQRGASICHRAGFSKMPHMIPLIANVILEKAPVIFGVGLIENAYHKTYKIGVLTNREIITEEPKLLNEARDLLPRLLPGKSDVLIVDWMGKNISGAGMDSNITGRLINPGTREPRYKAGKIAVLDLTPESNGSFHGVGNADVINRRIFEKGDMEITYPNAITSTTLLADKLPMMMKNDRETIQCAIKACNAEDPENPTVVRIANTLNISEIWVSENMVEALRENPSIEVTDEIDDWRFNNAGNLW